jgi:hypothetical protein
MSSLNPKIAFIGNQDNIAYRMCKWLRNAKYNVELFRFSKDNMRSNPILLDNNSDTQWVHIINNENKLWYFKKTKPYYAIESSFDIVVLTGLNGLLSGNLLGRIPQIYFPLGSEYTQGPFMHTKPSSSLSEKIMSFFLQKRIKSAKKVLIGTNPYLESAKKLGIQKICAVSSFPEDVEANRNCVNKSLLSKLNKTYEKYDAVFLWLSRTILDKTDVAYKGIDIFLEESFKILEESRYNIKVLIGDHGKDIKTIKKIIDESPFRQNFVFIPHLSFIELQTYLTINNAIVFDHLAYDGISGMTREALSHSAIL